MDLGLILCFNFVQEFIFPSNRRDIRVFSSVFRSPPRFDEFLVLCLFLLGASSVSEQPPVAASFQGDDEKMPENVS